MHHTEMQRAAMQRWHNLEITQRNATKRNVERNFSRNDTVISLRRENEEQMDISDITATVF